MAAEYLDEWLEDFNIDGRNYAVYEVFDNATGKAQYYDIYEVNEDIGGECINLGNLIYERPTEQSIRELLRQECK